MVRPQFLDDEVFRGTGARFAVRVVFECLPVDRGDGCMVLYCFVSYFHCSIPWLRRRGEDAYISIPERNQRNARVDTVGMSENGCGRMGTDRDSNPYGIRADEDETRSERPECAA